MSRSDERSYDLVVIGTGTAATTAAGQVRKAGRTVAVIDHKPFGGTCALRGCDPKKMLLAGEQAVDWARRMRPHGVEGELAIDWPALMAFKRSFTDPVPEHRSELFKKLGIEGLHGLARFTAPDTVEVNGTAVCAKHILIAAGAVPVPLHIPGEALLATSEDFLSLERPPRRIVLVGGGYIAAEFSHLAARAGAEVTILQRGPRLLERFEPELVEWLMPSFSRIGVDVRLGAEVKAVARCEAGYSVTAALGPEEVCLEADLVVHAAGRVPALDGLDLHAAEVAVEHGRLKLNQHLQSVSNPRVYAAGDAAGVGPPLTPVSSHDGKVIADNILHGPHRQPDYRGVPSVAFTIPPIASAGLTEAQAKAQGLRFRVHCAKASDWFTARSAAEPIYGYKTLVEEGGGRILGAHLVGPGVDQLINVFALAIRQGLKAEALEDTMFAYPTDASDLGYMVAN